MNFSNSLSWFFRVVLFIVVLTFALMNTQTVSLLFLPGKPWEVPMIVALLLFFALGAAFGVLACLPRLFRQRREIHKLKREHQSAAKQTLPPPEAG
jgi:putative membrane protein